MTRDSLQCLLDLLLLFLPADCTLPQTVYLLEKHSKQELDKPTHVYFCTSCLEDMTEEQNVLLCRTCNTQETKQELKDKGGHYLLLSIESQLRRYLQVYVQNHYSHDIKPPYN
jgi:hypothetical protein